MKLKLPDSTRNWMSLIGATIALITLFMIIFLLVVSIVFNQGGSYLGLVIYIILPAFMLVGLILIPIGMIRKRQQRKKLTTSEDKPLPFIDLNDPKHRNATLIFAIGSMLFLFISAIGSYEAFHYTESVEFCGETCHNVMKPQLVAYRNSPHARVKCVECHVGEGVNWYVRSKLSGLRQVYNVTLGEYPKPIPTPIKNLRPARETCEKCHWPQKFYSRNIQMERHYLRDEENTEWDVNVIMKVGASLSPLGLTEGIHWHINPDVKIEYAATDPKRQDIPWVKLTNKKTGEITVFESEDEPLEVGQLDSLEIREVDCIDCHNRPSHKYYPPEDFINTEITAGNISKDLPEIKSIAVSVCSEEFNSTDSALTYIKDEIENFYSENYPEIVEENSDLLQKAIKAIQDEFSNNIFPEMKVRWDQFPVNIGHLKTKGCFRCHDDQHVSDEGKVILKDCNLCHLINSQGTTDNFQYTSIYEPLEFIHPGGEIEKEDWEDSYCSDCHEGDGP